MGFDAGYYWRYASRLVRKDPRDMPLYLIHFVTMECGARCEHCFIPEESRSFDDLKIDEIDRATDHMKPFLFLFLTGGEAFRRPDLGEIAEMYYTKCHVRKMQIPTAGVLPDEAIHLSREICRRCPQAHLGVSLSIDAPDERHDKVRHVPGLFKKAVYTYRELKKLEREIPNLSINAGITVSALNQDWLGELYDFYKKELGVQNVLYTVTRGRPRNPDARYLDLEKVKAFNEKVDADLVQGAHGYATFPFASMVNVKNLIAHRMNLDQLENPGYRIPCYAGLLAGVLYSNGEVHPCELLEKPFGKLREEEYDFMKIWQSPTADALRGEIRDTKCFCTHECFLSTNILFNPRLLPPVAAKWAGLKVESLLAGNTASARQKRRGKLPDPAIYEKAPGPRESRPLKRDSLPLTMLGRDPGAQPGQMGHTVIPPAAKPRSGDELIPQPRVARD